MTNQLLLVIVTALAAVWLPTASAADMHPPAKSPLEPMEVSGADASKASNLSAKATPILSSIKPLFDFPVRDTSIGLGPDDTYYLTGTTEYPMWWKTNDGVRLWKSKDLQKWDFLGLVWNIDKDETWQKKSLDGKRAVWAPEIHYINGTFWIPYSMNYRGTGLLKSVTGKAEGPYRDVKTDGPLTGGIDASLFQDDDGKVYFLYGNDSTAAFRERPAILRIELDTNGRIRPLLPK